MLKKTSILIILISLCACNSGFNGYTQENNSLESEVLENNDLEEERTIGINTATVILDGGVRQYKIEYPYYIDNSNEGLDKVNKLIYDSAFPEDINEFFEYKEYSEDIQITYEIKYISDKIISILFSGYCSSGGSYADYKKSITIDIDKGSFLSLGDIISYSELQSTINDLVETDKCKIIPEILSENENKTQVATLCLSEFFQEDIMNNQELYYIKEDGIGLIGDYFPSMRQLVIFEFDLTKPLY